jgi:hypothetical protein
MAASFIITVDSNVITGFERMMLTESMFRQVKEYLDLTYYRRERFTGMNNVLNASNKFREIKKSNY